jgi:uncharacterized protein (DUF1499 family)
VSLLLSLVVAVFALGAAVGTRLDLWSFRIGFGILRWTVVGAVLTGLCSLLAFWITLPLRSEKRGFTLALLGLTISAIVVGIPVRWKLAGNETPPIHDITTDLDNPPRFNVISRYRDFRHNDLDREEPALSNTQKQHYPELESLTLNQSKRDCMRKVIEIARDSHWEFRSIDWEEGHVEATDRTFWFGFLDDIAIRVQSLSDQRCKIDLRSVSRYGVNDLGTNARRIRRFLRMVRSRSKI